jgi:selenocysteine-specific elongation factor
MGGQEPAPAHPLTLGTAGHIDHGKTALVRALTGIDTDRLEEEKRRGISIALGYAPLALPSGRRLSVIDVPGHERFVRTMVAGATGIDLFLMVVAADDGVMPQTREHAAVLRGLGVTAGVVAVTKCDIAEPDLGALRSFFGDVAIVPCSARTGEGVEDVRAALDGVAAGLAPRSDAGAPVLHVDRAFTVRGAGTVVTGTLWSGSLGRGDEVRILPAGRDARVRGVEVHDEARDRAAAGQRVAVNLAGVSLDEVRRGDVLAGADLDASFVVDVALDERVEQGTRVTIHHGTRETAARVAWLGGRFHQLRCEAPLVARRGDRLVVRSISPPDTLGGGVVLDPAARKHGPSRDVLARLERLARGEDPDPPKPASSGTPTAAVAEIVPLGDDAAALEARLRAAGLQAPALAEVDAAAFAALRAHGRAARVGALAFHTEVLADVERRIRAIIEAEGAVTLARLRDELQTSRKYAQALLEHFDARRLTRRCPDDSRVLSRRA